MTSIRRVTGTADLIALVPHLAGVACDDSVVLIPFTGTRSQGALRANRPNACQPDTAHRLAGHLIGMLCNLETIDTLVPVVITPARLDDTGNDRMLLAALVLAAHAAGITIRDAALVATDGWTSIEDPGHHPLPPATNDLPAAVDPATAAALPDHDPAAATTLDEHRYDARITAAAAFHAFDPTDAIEAAITATAPDALLATIAAIPVLRDLVLLQTGWGPDFGQQVWRRTVLDHSPLDADDPIALAYRGGNIRRPDATRLRALTAALHATAAATDGPERTGITAMLAWTQWALGCCSIAGHHAAAALTTDPGHGLASIVRTLVDTGTLPDWAYRAEPRP